MINNFQTHEHAKKAIEGLRQSLVYTYKLSLHVENNKISLNIVDPINYLDWVKIQSLMARKLGAKFLGQTDYDNEIKDINFTFAENVKTKLFKDQGGKNE